MLKDEDIRAKYSNFIWRFIPVQWRYWWIDAVVNDLMFEDVSIEEPSPIFIDRTNELDEWNADMDTLLLSRLASACNKHLFAKFLCP